MKKLINKIIALFKNKEVAVPKKSTKIKKPKS